MVTNQIVQKSFSPEVNAWNEMFIIIINKFLPVDIMALSNMLIYL